MKLPGGAGILEMPAVCSFVLMPSKRMTAVRLDTSMIVLCHAHQYACGAHVSLKDHQSLLAV